MLLGHARGKVGDLVFSRVNGQQVVRARAAVVKNPQTEAQIVQRVILNTISQAYSKMSSIVDHSFEGVAAGQKSMSYFMARNMKTLRETLAEVGDFSASSPVFSPIGTNGLASNTYVIAKGQLPEITPNVSSGAIAIALSANTYEAVLAATGLSRGDQLTLITVSGPDFNNQKFIFSRIILDPRNADGTEADLTSTFITDGAVNLPNPRNENGGHVYAFDGEDFTVSVTGQSINMGAAIASRQKASGDWMRSNAALILAEGADVGYTMEESINLFLAGGIDLESPYYLNNATTNGGSASFSPAPGPSPSPTPGATHTLTVTKQNSANANAYSDSAGTQVINSGASVEDGATVYVKGTAESGYHLTATINGTSVALTASGTNYFGSFTMPGQNSTLVINKVQDSPAPEPSGDRYLTIDGQTTTIGSTVEKTDTDVSACVLNLPADDEWIGCSVVQGNNRTDATGTQLLAATVQGINSFSTEEITPGSTQYIKLVRDNTYVATLFTMHLEESGD